MSIKKNYLLFLCIIFTSINYGFNNSYFSSTKTNLKSTFSNKSMSLFSSNLKEETNSTIFIDKRVFNASAIKQNVNITNNTYHLFSHGRSGELLINGKWCNPKEIVKFLKKKLSNQHNKIYNLNIYGCEFAKGDKGQKAITYIENILKVKIAASTNITGKDGDWFLEIGEIEMNIKNYQYNLQIENTGPDEDYDGDNVINIDDIDDDNDGISDTDEGGLCASTYSNINNIYIDASYHSSVYKDSEGLFYVAGESANATGNGNVVTPKEVTPANGYNYTGEILHLSVGGGGPGSGFVLITTDAMYNWGGLSNIGLNAGFGASGFAQMALPTGILPGDIVYLNVDTYTDFGNSGTTSIMDNNGEIYIVSNSNSKLPYGNNYITNAGEWGQVMLDASTPLTNIDQYSCYGAGGFAYSEVENKFYTWGASCYLGDGSGGADRAYATEMINPLPAGVTTSQIQVTSAEVDASYYILGSDGKIYVLGANASSNLGQGNNATLTSWSTMKSPSGAGEMTNVKFISASENIGFHRVSWINFITDSGTLYTVGSDNFNCAGIGGTANLPIQPQGSTNGQPVIYTHAGGHISSAIIENSDEVCHTGHNAGGAFGDGTTTNRGGFECYPLLGGITVGVSECTDTDLDGVPDYLDLDSDGDGCPDAIEGGDEFTATDLVDTSLLGGNTGTEYTGYSSNPVQVNLGNTVGADGMPIIAGTGQTVDISIIGALITIENTPEDLNICSDTSDPVIFTATATSLPTTDNINYEWLVSTDNGNTFSTTIQGANGMTSGVLSSGEVASLNITGIDNSFDGNIYKISFTTTNNSCPEETEAVLNIFTVSADAGEDFEKTCVENTSGSQIGSEPVSDYSYEWTPIEGLSDPNIANPVANPDSTTTYMLTVTNNEIDCSNSDSVTVTVNAPVLSANAGEDFEKSCLTNPSGSQIGSDPETGYSYLWSPIEGLSESDIANPFANPDSTTTYTLTITNDNTGCTDSDEITITVSSDIAIANTGDDFEKTCITNPSGNQIGSSPEANYTYLWSPIDGLSDPTIANPFANPDTTTTYTLTVANTSSGCTDSNTVTVTVNNTPATANAGEDFEKTCLTNPSGNQIGSDPLVGHTYVWTPVEGLSNSNIANPFANPDTTTTYTLNITNDTSGCTDSDSVTITVSNNQIVANAGADQLINCYTTSASIGTTPADGYTYSWSPTSGLSNSTSSNPTATPNSTTTYTVIITDTNNGCTDSDSVTVTVNNTPPTANAGEDKYIDCNTSSVTIGTNPVSGFTYSWSPTTGLNNSTISNPTASPTSTTTYTLEVTETLTGCTDTDDVVVTIDSPHSPSITAPNDIELEGCNIGSETVNADTIGFDYSTSLITLTPEQETTFLTFINADYSESCNYFITYQDELIDNSCPKVILRTYTITNSYGLSNIDTQQIIIRDNTPPTFLQTVEPSIYVFCNPVPEPQELAAIDNCTVVPNVNFNSETTTIDDQNYSIKRTWVATDECNNQTTVTQFVYVEETSENLNRLLDVCITDEPIDINNIFGDVFLDTEDSIWIINSTNTETSNIFSPNEFGIGNYMLSSTVTRGSCTLERSVTIKVHKDCVEVPCISSKDAISVTTLVSPNGDNKNEAFHVDISKNSESNSNCDINIHLEIYNRWGALVYKSDNYKNDWSGESPSDAIGNIEKLPRTTYYYIINLTNSGLAPIQGYFLLGKGNEE